MKRVVAAVLLVLLCLPAAAGAMDVTGCDFWLESGNVVMWAACRAVGWVLFNQAMDDLVWDLQHGGA